MSNTKAPDVTRERSTETMERVLGGTDKIILIGWRRQRRSPLFAAQRAFVRRKRVANRKQGAANETEFSRRHLAVLKHEHHANAAEKGETANIKQNIRHEQGFLPRPTAEGLCAP
jgi:hypothetical protein